MVVLALGAMACGGSGGSAVGSSPGPADGQRLWIKEQGQARPFENGHAVAIGSMNVEIYVSPYPPGRTANIDFYLTSDGAPVERANVSLQYDMIVMEHGPVRLLAVPTGGGHSLAALDFAMNGDFWLNVAVDSGSGESVINMLVRAVR